MIDLCCEGDNLCRAVTHSVAETQRLGMALAAQLLPGDVVLLRGNMGAGKSELTRGLARGLGITGYVTSPTFTILQVHEDGRLPLYHFDWYRISGADELYELSMDEYLYGNGIAVVEWPDRATEALPDRCLDAALSPLNDTDREIVFHPIGGFHALDYHQLSEVTL